MVPHGRQLTNRIKRAIKDGKVGLLNIHVYQVGDTVKFSCLDPNNPWADNQEENSIEEAINHYITKSYGRKD